MGVAKIQNLSRKLFLSHMYMKEYKKTLPYLRREGGGNKKKKEFNRSSLPRLPASRLSSPDRKRKKEEKGEKHFRKPGKSRAEKKAFLLQLILVFFPGVWAKDRSRGQEKVEEVEKGGGNRADICLSAVHNFFCPLP